MAKAEASFRAFLELNRNYLSTSDPSIRLQGARLEAEMKLRQQQVLTITLNFEQAMMEEKNDLPILNIIDTPNLPAEKSWPARAQWVLVSSALTLLASLLWGKREWLIARMKDDRVPLPVHESRESV